MSGGIQSFISEDGSQVLFDPQTGKYYTLLGNNCNTNGINYNDQMYHYNYPQNTKYSMAQNYGNVNYDQNVSIGYANGPLNYHQQNVVSQRESPKQQHHQKYQQQSNLVQKNMQQMACVNNTQHTTSTDKEQRAEDAVIHAYSPLQQEQACLNTHEAYGDDTHANMIHQEDTALRNKHTLNDSDEFITKGKNKTNKIQRRENQQQNKAQQQLTTSSAYEKQNKYNLPMEQLQRAVIHNLPCFVIKFAQADNLPAAVAVADDLYEHFTKNQIHLIEEFSVVRYSGIHLRIGVKNKEDYRILCTVKHWPSKILGRNISVIIPKFIPEQFSLVVRFVPKEFTTDQVAREVKRSASTANNFREIVYPYARATNDFRFSVTDLKEYNGLLRLGHIGIANMMRKITPYRPSNKLTYCTKCWKLGHTRNSCREQIQKCRICLENYDQQHNDTCSKEYKCAQCHQSHYSLDGECPEIQQHRQQLNKAVKEAVKDGAIKDLVKEVQISSSHRPTFKINKSDNNFPHLPATTTSNLNTRPAPWVAKNSVASTNQSNDISNEQLLEKIRNHIDINSEQTNSRLVQMKLKIEANEETITSLHNRLANMVGILQSIIQIVAHVATTPSSTAITNSEFNVAELLTRATIILKEEANIINREQKLKQIQAQAQDDDVIMMDESQVKDSDLSGHDDRTNGSNNLHA